jgi:hypothetical protein
LFEDLQCLLFNAGIISGCGKPQMFGGAVQVACFGQGDCKVKMSPAEPRAYFYRFAVF